MNGWRIIEVANGFILHQEPDQHMMMDFSKAYVFTTANDLGSYIARNFEKLPPEETNIHSHVSETEEVEGLTR